jgi:hypothetical protein
MTSKEYASIEHGRAALAGIKECLQWAHDGRPVLAIIDALRQEFEKMDRYLTGSNELTNPARYPMARETEDFVNGGSWIIYLSDGGYSRLVVNWERNWYRLDGPPSASVLDRWNQLNQEQT